MHSYSTSNNSSLAIPPGAPQCHPHPHPHSSCLFTISATALLISATTSSWANPLKSWMNLLSVFLPDAIHRLLGDITLNPSKVLKQTLNIIDVIFPELHQCLLSVPFSFSNSPDTGPPQVVGLKSFGNSSTQWLGQRVMFGGKHTTLIVKWQWSSHQMAGIFLLH